MTRLLLSATTDLDAEAHVRSLIDDGAQTIDVVTREWPLIARAALRLRRSTRTDELVTVGEAALLAATFAGRAPASHLPVGAPTDAELAALRRRGRVRVIVSTSAAYRLLRRGGVAPTRIDVRMPPVLPSPRSRDDARRRLGLDAFTLVLPGTIRPGSGHRLAIWASALLAYRDPTWRFLVSGRGDVDRTRAFLAATMPPDADAIRLVDEADEADAIAAADLALFANDGTPERSAIEACARARVPIVGPRTLVESEKLDVAATFDPFKARHVARAVLVAFDRLDAGGSQSRERPQFSA